MIINNDVITKSSDFGHYKNFIISFFPIVIVVFVTTVSIAKWTRIIFEEIAATRFDHISLLTSLAKNNL